MRNNRYAGVAAIAALLLGTACAKKGYEGETPTPAEGAPAEVARADSAGQQTPDSAGQAVVGRDSAAALPAAPPAPPSLALDATADGQSIFRHDTFGNEAFWTDTMKMHEIIEAKLDPTTAMKLGLKVDAEALPAGALEGADLNSPATTLVLLKANAIVGIKAVVDENNHLTRVGITCALCHSTVDNSVQEGIGRRMDGWPNRQLNVGAIIALSPTVTDQQREVFNSWGPGKYDPRFNQDGKNFPVVLPPAYGLAKIENSTYTAEGTISYWNSYVAITQMHGIGKLVGRDGNPAEAEQTNQAQPAPAERGDTMTQRTDSTTMPKEPTQQSNVPAPAANPMPENQHQQNQDLVTPKLPALRDYQHSLEAPAPPEGSFDQASATRGERVFRRACMSCHVGITGTDNNSTQAPSEVTPGGNARDAAVKGKVHAANETGMDPQYAERSENKGYRTTPLRGLWQHAPYFHDGSAATLADVVTHYNKTLKLKLTSRQQKDLVEFLKSK